MADSGSRYEALVLHSVKKKGRNVRFAMIRRRLLIDDEHKEPALCGEVIEW